MVEGDLRAQLGAIMKGRERLEELCLDYGRDVVLKYVDEIIAYTSRRAAAAFAAIPDGLYRGTAWMDTDGFELEHLELVAEIAIDGSDIAVDFTASAPQTQGGTNGSFATLQAAGAVPFLYYIDADIPHNHGILDHLRVVGKEGTLCWARFPGSTSTATVMPSDAMQAAINRAMVHVLPDRVPAGGTRFSNVPQVSGNPSRGFIPWRFSFINNAGGGPASKGADGWPLWVTEGALGAMKIHPVEQLELLYPVLIEQLEIEPDSCGFGQWIGGTGVRAVLRPLDDHLVVVTFGDGMLNPPHGAMGGEPGIGGGHYVEDTQTRERRFYSTCAEFLVRYPAEVYVGVSTGGGGWGPAYARDIEQVRTDVRNGILTRGSAQQVFGVVLSDDADLEVDHDSTNALRARLSAQKLAHISPNVPNANQWIRTMMRDGDEYILNPRL
jgi:N-methylhydantoinase B